MFLVDQVNAGSHSCPIQAVCAAILSAPRIGSTGGLRASHGHRPHASVANGFFQQANNGEWSQLGAILPSILPCP